MTLAGATGGHPAAGVHNSMAGSAADGMTRLGTPRLAGGAASNRRQRATIAPELGVVDIGGSTR